MHAGGLMLGLECASFEVTTAFAGYLGPAAVAAHAGVFSLTSLNYIALPFALATAATIRVGNLLVRVFLLPANVCRSPL